MTDSPTASARLRTELQDGRRGRLVALKWFLGLAVVAALAAGLSYLRTPDRRPVRVTMGAGSELSHRFGLATHLREASSELDITITLEPTRGSVDTLARVSRGELDVAFVQGGIPTQPNVRQLATLVPEPLHLLVKPEHAGGGLTALRGRTLNLSTSGSGTYYLAVQVLAFVGMTDEDFERSTLSYSELRDAKPEDLPDGVFVVGALPSSMATWLVAEHDFRLMPLPYGPAMTLQDRSLGAFEIPPYTYGVEPAAVPAEPLPTVAAPMAVVAHVDVPETVVTRLMEAIHDGGFLRAAELPQTEAADVRRLREYPLHPGADVYLQRDAPVLNGEFIEGVENLRSFIVSSLVAAFLVWQWYRRRQLVGFEAPIDAVTRVELEILDLAERNALTSEAVLAAELKLTRLKAEALEQFSSGRLRGDEQMSGFLVHVTDARNLLRRFAATVERQTG